MFAPDRDRLEPRWIHWLTKTRDFWDQCDAKSQGTSGKNRIRPERILEVDIPLPPLADQRRIVAQIEGLVARINEVQMWRQHSADEVEVVARRVAYDLFPEPTDGAVGDWVSFQTGYAFKSEWFSEDGVRLARNANIGHGRLDWADTVRLPDALREQFQRFELEAGDLLISLDRPLISTGVKVARVQREDLPCLLLQRVARAHFRDKGLLPDYFFRWLRSPRFADAIDPGRSNGVPHISHKDIERIPFTVPSIAGQKKIVAALEALETEVDELKRLQTRIDAELGALLPSIFDKAFRGEL